jgi:xylan 1,4-beta-xylosidase
VSELKTEPLAVASKDGQVVFEVELPAQAVAAIRFDWS